MAKTPKKPKSLIITKSIVAACRRAGACAEGYRWIKRRQRTLSELYALCPDWAEWLAINIALPVAHAAELQRLTGYRSWWRNGQRLPAPAKNAFFGGAASE